MKESDMIHFTFKKDLSGSSTRDDLSAHLSPPPDTYMAAVHMGAPTNTNTDPCIHVCF